MGGLPKTVDLYQKIYLPIWGGSIYTKKYTYVGGGQIHHPTAFAPNSRGGGGGYAAYVSSYPQDIHRLLTGCPQVAHSPRAGVCITARLVACVPPCVLRRGRDNARSARRGAESLGAGVQGAGRRSGHRPRTSRACWSRAWSWAGVPPRTAVLRITFIMTNHILVNSLIMLQLFGGTSYPHLIHKVIHRLRAFCPTAHPATGARAGRRPRTARSPATGWPAGWRQSRRTCA